MFTELEQANINKEEQDHLEEQFEKLNNVEEIKRNLSEGFAIATNEEVGLQSLLYSLQYKLETIASFGKEFEELSERISSVKIELDDIVSELEVANENIEFSPAEVEKINERLQLLYNLQKKHYVNSNNELLVVLEELSQKVATVESADEIILQKQKEIVEIETNLDVLASQISEARALAIPELNKKLKILLADLGMKNALFSIEVRFQEQYFSNGKDELTFQFSANKGGSFGELKKVASGGELSRIMLAVKAILSQNTKLPTIIFDEIDTGVSGEVSNKIANIMQQMSRNMQVVAITHLPQIAAKGNQHYKVFKEDKNNVTTSNLKQLSQEERIIEIAEMLSGKDISESALIHAKELLFN